MSAGSRGTLLTVLLGAALLVSVLLSLGLGSADVGLGEALEIVGRSLGLADATEPAGRGDPSAQAIPRGAAESSPDVQPIPRGAAESVVLQIRLPRTLLAILVGMLLSLSGVIMQAFFRNIMAEPYLVGVSSGAALGAVLAMLLGWSFRLGWFSTVPLSAFVFALGIVLLVYLINLRRGGLRTNGLLLSGIAVASAISAIVALLMVTSERSIQQILFWLLGSLEAARWEHIGSVAPYALIGVPAALYFSRDLDLLLWGDVTGAALGLHVSRSRTLLLVIASLMAAAAVAVAGVIGFVGLMVPHLARGAVGTLHRRLIPAAGLLGGLLLLWADVLARTLWAPAELPVGAITAIVGAPFLVYLCTRGPRMGI
ncbi:MAG: iron chelate uptake ABC transporter family permease subunit [Candidatus Eisenbacteria bacterium]|nr:iron chelate uptake ABC transporter family permease subunit [Candidatus Eisenbacteria bacterium]